jgi:hypothetical protein
MKKILFGSIFRGFIIFPCCGCFALISLNSSALNADFHAEPTEAVVNQDISFFDDSTGSPTSWDWDFGDANSSSDQESYGVNPIFFYISKNSVYVSAFIKSLTFNVLLLSGLTATYFRENI